jgi:hypothetical protein
LPSRMIATWAGALAEKAAGTAAFAFEVIERSLFVQE